VTSGQTQPAPHGGPVPAAASKIPEVSLCFWLTKVLITGASVAWPDYLYRHLGVVPVSGSIGLLVLALQLSRRGYHAWIYWLAMAAVSVARTEAANGLHTVLGLPYLIAAIWYLAVLAVVLAAWWMIEKTLSLRSIITARREMFYWAAVTAAFALGTAIGHQLTPVLQQAFRPPDYLALWAAVTGLAALTWRPLRLDAVLVFWFAFTVTRPLGAAIAEFMALPTRVGGLGLGRWPVSLGLAITVAGLVGSMARASRAQQR
jgi:uncharacterized membrane-anchored protein